MIWVIISMVEFVIIIFLLFKVTTERYTLEEFKEAWDSVSKEKTLEQEEK